MSGLIKVTKDRILWCVPPPPMKPWARRLSDRCKQLVPPWSLDHCWVPGRGLPMAEAKVAYMHLEQFIDIRKAFPSVEQDRLWRMLRSEPRLLTELRRFFDQLCCEEGLPEG